MAKSRVFEKRTRTSHTALLSGIVALSCLPALGYADLLGFYPLNGNAQDASGAGNNGTIQGTVSFANTGPFGGQALVLDGTSKANFVSVPINTAIENTPQETFGGWFLVAPTADTGSIRGLISSDNGNFDPTLDVDTRNGGFQYSAFVGGSLISDGQANTGAWTFVAVSYDNIAHTYLFQVGNTLLSGTTNFDGSGVENVTDIGINPNFDSEFQGSIADVFFYNTALTAPQLATIEQNGPSAILSPEPASLSVLALAAPLLVRRRRTR